jgi:hypothetical protein
MKTDFVKQALKWTFVLCLLLSIQRGEAQFVELTAEIHAVRWVYQGTNNPPAIATKNWTIRCVVGTNTWLIEEDFPPAKDAWCFTGSNVMTHSVLTGYPSERKELFERSFSEMVVDRGCTKVVNSQTEIPFPPPALLAGTSFDVAALHIPWLAFCSGSYLKREDCQVPLPSMDYWSYPIIHSDKFTVFEDVLGLPRVADFYAGDGQPVCRYRALEPTNVLGWSFPLRFELAQYRNEFGQGPWELSLTASGKVIAIGVGSQPEIPTESQKAIERKTALANPSAGQVAHWAPQQRPDMVPLLLGSAVLKESPKDIVDR